MAKIVTTPGKLYILRERDYRTREWHPYVKIGIVRNEKEASTRIAEHQTGNPREIIEVVSLNAPFVENLETHLHYVFGEYWVTGEWFLMDDAKVDEVVRVAKQVISEQESLSPFLETIGDFEEVLSNGVLLKSNSILDDIHRDLIDVSSKIKILEAKYAINESVLLSRMVGHGSIPGIVELRINRSGPRLDKSALEQNHKTIYDSFCSIVTKFSGKFNIKGALGLSKLDPALNMLLKASPSPSFIVSDAFLPMAVRDSEMENMHLDLIKLNADLKKLEWQEIRLSSQLQAAVMDHEGVEGLCTWSRINKDVVQFDEKAFVSAHPSLAQSHQTNPKETVSTIVSVFRAY